MAATDGIVKVDMTSDEMSAVVFIMPPADGGKEIDVVDVKKALREAGVIYGIVNEEKIRSFCEEGKLIPIDFLGAVGTPPGSGEDASIMYVWQQEKEVVSVNKDVKIDFHELNIVHSVNEGEVIARKMPPTRGPEGIAVTGKKTPGEWGSDVSSKAGANVVVSEDGTEFIAKLSGSPKLAGGVLSVDPVYVVNGDVDFSTGNINFAGALDIKGNVSDTFIVKAEGNVTIGGNIQAAQIISGGDIIVKGGIITRFEGFVSARGKIVAKFIENSEVESDSDVIVDRAIINSKIRSNGMVICTSQEGKIMGGDIMAFQEIRAKHLGTDKETKTYLRAGFKYDVYLELSEVEDKFEKVILEQAANQKNITGAKNPSPELLAELKKKQAVIDAQKTDLQKRVNNLKAKVQVNPYATVKGEEFIHPGCHVYVGAAKERIGKPMRFATLSASKDGSIALSSYDELTGKIKTTSVGKSEKLCTVLVVDDAKFMRAKLKSILETGNFKILGEAEDGKIAVQLYAKLKPDLVTMDITMPNVDGITALKAIKKINPEAKVVMISALGQKDKVKDAIIAGASDFIIKPFIPEKVVECLTRITKNK